MVDGEVQGCGLWANMCADCFRAYGTKIGWGHGQLYKRDANGWLLVGGLCPDSEQKSTFDLNTTCFSNVFVGKSAAAGLETAAIVRVPTFLQVFYNSVFDRTVLITAHFPVL